MAIINFNVAKRKAVMQFTKVKNSFTAITSIPKNFFERKTISIDSFLSGYTDIQKQLILQQGLQSTSIYAKSFIVNLCVRIVATSISSLIPAVILLDMKSEEAVKDNDIKNLIFNKPNSIDTGSELMTWNISNKKLTGNAYIEVISNGTGDPYENPIALEPLFADRVTPIAGEQGKINEDGGVEGHIKEYIDNTGGEDRPIPVENMIHIKSYNPISRIEGMSELEAMGVEIKRSEQISDYQETTFRKGMFPSMNIHTDQRLNTQDQKDIKKSLDDQYVGVDGERRLVTHSGLKAQVLSLSPADMKVLESERHTGAMIAIGLGIPGELLGDLIEHKNVATYREANKQLVAYTTVPQMMEFLAKYNHYFFPMGDFEFRLTEHKIPALRAPIEELEKSWWMSPNEKRVLQGLPPSEDENMKKIYVPANFVLLDDLNDSGVDGDNL